ncbi:MAG: leucine-rich repeat domain-containing protein [Planctomycetes bacterium]|nr:leucine-rich repeat domain-containing protein [Planctomycetota bacterium]
MMWNSEEGGFPLQRCCLVFGLIVVTAGQTAHAAPVNFADANLKACVEAALNVSNPTPTDMLALTELQVCRNKGITDLTGIEYATNLTDLDLQRNQISDISALAGLTNLDRLILSDNQISDISALAGLTSLTNLRLPDNKISDISSVSGLNRLVELHLGVNKISDISALAGLTNLEILRLPENQISDISPLSGLTSLTNLRLSGNQISDISALAGLTSLTDLRLSRNQISDISALAGLTSLTGLTLRGNQIIDVSPLSGLTELGDLNLGTNPLNQEACDIYIPQIKANNPGIFLKYDECVFCEKILTVSSTTGGSTTTPAGDGEFSYYCGSIVPLVGSPQIGYHFVNWKGDKGTIGNTSDPVTTITMNGDYTIQANFALDTHSLTISSSAGGSVTAPGEGSFGSYSYGTVVNIVATPQTGYRFVNWTGDTGTLANTSDPTTTIAMNGDYSIQANFALSTHNLTTSSSAGGSVTTPGEGVFGPYSYGTVVNIVATPQTGYHFVNWTGETGTIANTSDPITTIAMNGDSIQANFALDTHSLTTSSSAGGSVTTPGEGAFGPNSYGTVMNIVATPRYGYRFVNWTGDTGTLANTSDPTTTIAMNGDYSIQANFAPGTYSLTTSSSAGGSVTTPGEGSFGRYDRGTEVDLVATPQTGYRFVNWTGKTGNIRNRSHPTTTIAMYRDYNIQANFAEADPNTITETVA